MPAKKDVEKFDAMKVIEYTAMAPGEMTMVCSICGAAIFDTRRHDSFHSDLGH